MSPASPGDPLTDPLTEDLLKSLTDAHVTITITATVNGSQLSEITRVIRFGDKLVVTLPTPEQVVAGADLSSMRRESGTGWAGG